MVALLKSEVVGLTGITRRGALRHSLEIAERLEHRPAINAAMKAIEQ
jgi:hypothetical protein